MSLIISNIETSNPFLFCCSNGIHEKKNAVQCCPFHTKYWGGGGRRRRMVVGFTTTCVISVYHHKRNIFRKVNDFHKTRIHHVSATQNFLFFSSFNFQLFKQR
jgi:hypothetical protein